MLRHTLHSPTTPAGRIAADSIIRPRAGLPRSGKGHATAAGRAYRQQLRVAVKGMRRHRPTARTVLGRALRAWIHRHQRATDSARHWLPGVPGRNRHHRIHTARRPSHRTLPQVHGMRQGMPGRGYRRRRQLRRTQMPELSHNRIPWPAPRRDRPRRQAIRMRHMPGRMPAQPRRRTNRDRGILAIAAAAVGHGRHYSRTDPRYIPVAVQAQRRPPRKAADAPAQPAMDTAAQAMTGMSRIRVFFVTLQPYIPHP